MKITFDRNNPRLTVSELPEETKKVKLTIPAHNLELTGSELIEMGNFSLNLNATLEAVKTEEVTEEVPILVNGEQVIIEGIVQTEPITSIVETILETQNIDLKVL